MVCLALETHLSLFNCTFGFLCYIFHCFILTSPIPRSHQELQARRNVNVDYNYTDRIQCLHFVTSWQKWVQKIFIKTAGQYSKLLSSRIQFLYKPFLRFSPLFFFNVFTPSYATMTLSACSGWNDWKEHVHFTGKSTESKAFKELTEIKFEEGNLFSIILK